MFNPKITEGEWVLLNIANRNDAIGMKIGVKEIRFLDWPKEDMKAIAAVPELLKVYKAAREVVDAAIVVAQGESYGELDSLYEAIENLEKKHCKEQNNNG